MGENNVDDAMVAKVQVDKKTPVRRMREIYKGKFNIGIQNEENRRRKNMENEIKKKI